MRYCCLAFLFLLISVAGSAQQFTIPAFTGYAVPVEKGNENLFSEKNGLQNWVDTRQKISYYFFVRKAGGSLAIAIDTKNKTAGSRIKLTVAGKPMEIAVPLSDTFRSVQVGTVQLQDSGYYNIEVEAVKKTGNTIADISAIHLSGSAAENIHANLKPRRNAASVHLRYLTADTLKAVAFYNEVTVAKGADPVHSYYMACGFSRGYFGIQVNSEKERRVIFSVWDAGNEAVDRSKVADTNKVQLLAKGEDVFADGFGNEGTGGHSHWVYNWAAGNTYKFLVTALPDSARQRTIYTGYIYLPELLQWKLIASFSAPKDGGYIRNPYSFIENFWGTNGQLERKALFGNQWVQGENGKWTELSKASFTCDATGKARDRIDFGGGVEDGRFFLLNGGFKPVTGKYGNIFTRTAENQRPVIDWSKNVDSARQAAIDRQLILGAVKAKKIDTAGSVGGVFYTLLKQGSGRQVSPDDTVTVYYKGSLLKDGSIFDQTKEKPATFPLKRLIRGWQLGVPLCRVGGKIRLVIPSALAYTIRSRSKAIPPNSVLVFDIEVLEAKTP